MRRITVVIVGPHLKRGSELGVHVEPKSSEGEYEGWYWPMRLHLMDQLFLSCFLELVDLDVQDEHY